MRLFEVADRYCKESSWKTLALLKMCLFSVGVMVGMLVPKEKGCLWHWRCGIPCNLHPVDGETFPHMADGRTGENRMNHEKVYSMSFSKIYPLLVSKAEKKGVHWRK